MEMGAISLSGVQTLTVSALSSGPAVLYQGINNIVFPP